MRRKEFPRTLCHSSYCLLHFLPLKTEVCCSTQMFWLRHSGSHISNLEVVACLCYKCGKAVGVLAVMFGQIKDQLRSCE